MISQPQDHNPPAKKMLRDAVSLQAANLLQKAQLDMMATKLILALKIVKPVGVKHATKGPLKEVADILSMTRDETAEARKSFAYPDERIQAVIDRATQEIADILLEHGQ